MGKISLKDGQISSSAGINIPGSLTVSGNMIIGDYFTDTLSINSNTTFIDDCTVLDVLSGTVGRFTTITGSTVTGSFARFTVITGSTVSGSTALFTTITGSTVSGSTALFTTITGSTVTGSTALFTTITATTGNINTLTIDSFLISADLSVNGGDISSTATTFNILNNNVTTVNAFSSSNIINIGGFNSTSTTLKLGTSNSGAIAINSNNSIITDSAEIGRFSVIAPITSSSTTLGSRGVIAVERDGLNGACKIVLNVGVDNSTSTRTRILTATKTGVLIRDGLLVGSTSGAVVASSGIISSSGNIMTAQDITAAGNLITTNGNLIIGQSGKGIDFSVTSGTGTSELLDDYEEGTFTTTIRGSVTNGVTTGLTNNFGSYTKIGRCVHIDMPITWTGHTGTGGIVLEGLPFSSINSGPLSTYHSSLGASGLGTIIGLLGGNAVWLYNCSSNSTASLVAIDSAASLRICGTYLV